MPYTDVTLEHRISEWTDAIIEAEEKPLTKYYRVESPLAVFCGEKNTVELTHFRIEAYNPVEAYRFFMEYVNGRPLDYEDVDELFAIVAKQLNVDEPGEFGPAEWREFFLKLSDELTKGELRFVESPWFTTIGYGYDRWNKQFYTT